MGASKLEAGERQTPAHAAGTDDDLVGFEPQPALGDDGVRIGETRSASALVDGHSQGIDPLAHGNMRIHIVDHFAYPCKQSAIIEHRFAHGAAEST